MSPLTSNGIPSYRDQGAPDECDIFARSGAEDFVELDADSGAPTTYRPRTKGLFAGITHRIETDGVATDHQGFEVSTKVAAIHHSDYPGRRA